MINIIFRTDDTMLYNLSVNETKKIKSYLPEIENLINIKNFSLLYNGEILDINKTFKRYKIPNDTVILVYKHSETNTEIATNDDIPVLSRDNMLDNIAMEQILVNVITSLERDSISVIFQSHATNTIKYISTNMLPKLINEIMLKHVDIRESLIDQLNNLDYTSIINDISRTNDI
jgi:hypothetical protein